MQPISIKAEFIAKAAEATEKNNQEVVYKGAVNKIHDRGGTDARILIITKQYICYFRNDNKAQQDRLHYWNHIKVYNYNYPSIELEFESKKGGNEYFRFTSPVAQTIQMKIFDILYHVLSEDELSSLNLQRFSIPKYTVNGLGIKERYHSILAQEENSGSMSIEQQLLEYLPTYNKTFVLKNEDSLGEYLVPLCQALVPYKSLESLIIPRLKEGSDLYESLQEIFCLPGFPVRHLSVSNQPDNYFKPFLDSLLDSKKISALTFRDITMTRENLELLQRSIIRIQNFNSIAFQNVIKKANFDEFVEQFLNGYTTQKLRMFNLDCTTGLNLSQVVKDLPVINSLSFADCNLDISKALETISEADLKNLRFLNLSGNHGKTEFSDNFELPEELVRLDVNNITWNDGVFSSFTNFIFNKKFKKGISLYIEDVHATEQDWENAERILGTTEKHPLVELGWSGNIVNDNILSFLQKNRKLTTLFISRTFSKDNLQPYTSFVNTVNSLKSLKNLVIQGTEDKYLGTNISDLIRKLVDHPSLTLLDISNQKIQDEGIRELSNLVEKCPKLQYLIFDNSNIQNLCFLIELAKCAQERLKPISVQYPVPDLKAIAASEKDKSKRGQILKDMAEIKHSFELASKSRNEESPAPQKSKPVPSMLQNPDFLKNLQETNKKNRRERTNSLRLPNYKKVLTLNPLKASEADEYQDPNYSVFLGTFDYFVSEFTDEFPLYITDKLLKEFDVSLKAEKERRHSRRSHREHSDSQSKAEKGQEADKEQETEKDKEIDNDDNKPEEVVKSVERSVSLKQDKPKKNEGKSSKSSEKVKKEVKREIQKFDENEEEEWVDVDDEEQNEEEEQPETPSFLSNLYREMNYDCPQYKDLVDTVEPPDDSESLSDLKNYLKLTPLINKLVPK